LVVVEQPPEREIALYFHPPDLKWRWLLFSAALMELMERVSDAMGRHDHDDKHVEEDGDAKSRGQTKRVGYGATSDELEWCCGAAEP
jgi:hypothetical protein